METILLEANNSTFISSAEKDKNFYPLDYISLSNYNSGKCNIKCDTLMNFNLDIFNNNSTLIHNAYLVLPLEIFKEDSLSPLKELSIYRNIKGFCYDAVSWNTRPESCLISSISVTPKIIKSKHILIDITNAVVDWLYNKVENHGITLSWTSNDIVMILPKERILYSPKLLLKYSTVCNKCSKPVGLYLQGNNLTGSVLNAQEVIKFNNVVEKTPEGINYDENTGIITINKPGFYNCHWELNLDGSLNISAIDIALKNLTKESITNFNIPVTMMGQVIGNALIEVTEPEEMFVLLNNSENSLQFSQINIQSSLLFSII